MHRTVIVGWDRYDRSRSVSDAGERSQLHNRAVDNVEA